MKSKILKFLIVGLWIPSTMNTSSANTSTMDAPVAKEAALKNEITEDAYSILMRARVGVQNWSKSSSFQSNSAFSYGTDIGAFWKSGFGVLGHFWTGQSSSTDLYQATATTRLSTLAIGPAFQLRKGKSYFQAHLFVGQLIVNENNQSAAFAGYDYKPNLNDGYRIYGASLGVDVPLGQEWFGSLIGEYGFVKSVGVGTNFAVNSLSTGVGYRF